MTRRPWGTAAFRLCMWRPLDPQGRLVIPRAMHCTGRFASLDDLLLNVSEFEAGMVQRGKEAVDADLLTHSS